MKVYSKWWPMAMWTYKALVNELGSLALGSSSLQYLCDTRRCGIPDERCGKAREQWRVLLRLQREGRVSTESGIQVC